jgi:hypothetical protein
MSEPDPPQPAQAPHGWHVDELGLPVEGDAGDFARAFLSFSAPLRRRKGCTQRPDGWPGANRHCGH